MLVGFRGAPEDDVPTHDVLSRRQLSGSGEGIAGEIWMLTMLCTVVIACIVGESLIERYHVWWMTESGASIVIGLVVGGLAYGLTKHTDMVALEHLEFDPEFFTLVLLPPIIFESGYNLNHFFFFSNLGGILLYAFIGTNIAFLVIGFSLYYGLGGSTGLLTPMEAAAFAALISAVDPVATLAIFGSTGADPKLNALIFGESVLNDAVSIVLFKVVLQLSQTTRIGINGWADFTAEIVFESVGIFIFIFLGSLLIGAMGGMLISLVFKLSRMRTAGHPETAASAELICLVCLAYGVFLLAEISNLSGIVAALSAGAVTTIYVKHNLTPQGSALCMTVIRAIARFTETIIFILMGCGFWIYVFAESDSAAQSSAHGSSADAHGGAHAPASPPSPSTCRESGFRAEHENIDGYFVVLTISLCLMARALGVFPLSLVINAWRPRDKRIKLNEQAVIWFSGLRGAIALALAVDFPQFPSTAGTPGEGNFCWQRAHVIACTIVVVLFTVFVMGGLTVPVLKLCGIPMGVTHQQYKKQKTKSRDEGWEKKWSARVKWLDTHLIRPILIASESAETDENTPLSKLDSEKGAALELQMVDMDVSRSALGGEGDEEPGSAKIRAVKPPSPLTSAVSGNIPGI